MTIDKLITRFEELEYLTNYNETHHTEEFRQTRDLKIIDLLVNKIPAPVLFKEWKDQASTLDRQQHCRDEERKMMASRQNPLPASSFTTKPKQPYFVPRPRWADFKQSLPAVAAKPSPLAKDSNAMDIDATRKS